MFDVLWNFSIYPPSYNGPTTLLHKLKTMISDRSQISLCSQSDFRLVQVIRVGSATGMSETGMRWFFRPASCEQKQAFVWRPIWSRTGLSSYRSHVIRAEEQATRIFCQRLSNSEKLSGFVSSRQTTEGIEKYGIKHITEGGGGGGTMDFKSQGWSHGDKKSKPKKIPRASNKT